jgi:hypothetical protein
LIEKQEIDITENSMRYLKSVSVPMPAATDGYPREIEGVFVNADNCTFDFDLTNNRLYRLL